ncbi:sigma factor-like helix-turn-helix DNA-binding protein [Pseudomonas sp. NA13]
MHRVEQSLGRPAKEREIADAMGLTLAQYHQVLSDTNGSQMLPIDDVNEEHIDETCSRHITPSPNWSTIATAPTSCAPLTPSRAGKTAARAVPPRKLNLREIGLVLGVSESRVCQLHSQAIARLRASMAE